MAHRVMTAAVLLTASVSSMAGCDRPEPSTDGQPAVAIAPQVHQAEPSIKDGADVGAVAPQTADCTATTPPAERVAGTLTVRYPPDLDARTIDGRLRSHSAGPLTVGAARKWVGPAVPAFVPLKEDDAELFLLQTEAQTTIAFYRDMYGSPSCDLSTPTNCSYYVRAWDQCGEPMWARRLNDFMSRPDRLEVQDVRVADGVVYFNEACQSYSREAGGKCSALVALDPVAGEVVWRTDHLVSNNRFIVHGDYIIGGYGFTAERDYLHVVRRADGKVMQRLAIPSAHEVLWVEADLLIAKRYPNNTEEFVMENFDGANPRLVAAGK